MSRIWKLVAVTLMLGFGVHSTAQQPATLAADKVVHAGRLIDGVSATVRERVSILIAGDRVIDVQPGFVNPAGAQIVDLARATVMPGLIDSHTLITSEPGPNAIVEAVTKGPVA